MAMYYCHPCGNYIDDDYHPGEDVDGDLVCPDCVENIMEKAERQEDAHQDSVPGPCGNTRRLPHWLFNTLVCCRPEKHSGSCNFVIRKRIKP